VQAWLDIHMTAEDAVRAARDLGTEQMFPLHWATFNLQYHDWNEPIKRATAEAARIGVQPITPRVGEMVGSDFRSITWW